MRAPTYRFLIDADHNVFKLIEQKTSYFYKPVGKLVRIAEHVRAGDKLRTLLNREAMVPIGDSTYLVTHACVPACHCPHCGADVGNLCFRKDDRGLIMSTHYARRDLWRQNNDGRATRRRK